MMPAKQIALQPGSDAWRQLYTSTKVVDLMEGNAIRVFNTWFGITPPFAGNTRTRWGNRLERVIIDAAAEDQGWGTVEFPGTVIAADNPLLATTADFVAQREIAGDAKNRGADQAHRYVNGEATERELTQVTWHAGILGLPRCAVAVLIGGNDLRVYEFPFDADLFGGLKELVARFHRDHVVTQRPPPMDATDDAADYLRAKFPFHSAPLLQADDATTNLALELRSVRAERERLEAREGELTNTIKHLIGNAEGIAGPGFKATWKATKPTRRTDWQAVAHELGASTPVIDRYTTEAPGSRRFLMTWKEN
jgi:predicted phage-related endonuclease